MTESSTLVQDNTENNEENKIFKTEITLPVNESDEDIEDLVILRNNKGEINRSAYARLHKLSSTSESRLSCSNLNKYEKFTRSSINRSDSHLCIKQNEKPKNDNFEKKPMTKCSDDEDSVDLIPCVLRRSESIDTVDRIEQELSNFVMDNNKKKEKKRSNSFRKLFSVSFFGKDKKKKTKDVEAKRPENSENYQNETNSNSFIRNTPQRHTIGCDHYKNRSNPQRTIEEDPPPEIMQQYANFHINKFQKIRRSFENPDDEIFDAKIENNDEHVGNSHPFVTRYIDTSSSTNTLESDKQNVYNRTSIEDKMKLVRNESLRRETPPRAQDTIQVVNIVKPKARLPRSPPNPYNERNQEGAFKTFPQLNDVYGTVFDAIPRAKSETDPKFVPRIQQDSKFVSGTQQNSRFVPGSQQDSRFTTRTAQDSPASQQDSRFTPRSAQDPPISLQDERFSKRSAQDSPGSLQDSRFSTRSAQDSPGSLQDSRFSTRSGQDSPASQQDSRFTPRSAQDSPASQQNARFTPRSTQDSPASLQDSRFVTRSPQHSPQDSKYVPRSPSLEMTKLRLPPNRDITSLQPRLRSPLPTKVSPDKITTESLKNIVNGDKIESQSSLERKSSVSEAITALRNELESNDQNLKEELNQIKNTLQNLTHESDASPRGTLVSSRSSVTMSPIPKNYRVSPDVERRQKIPFKSPSSPSKDDMRKSVEAYYWKEIKRIKEQEDYEIYLSQLHYSNGGYAEDPVCGRRSRGYEDNRRSRSSSVPRNARQQLSFDECRPLVIPEGRTVVYTANGQSIYGYTKPPKDVAYKPIFRRGSLSGSDYQPAQNSKKVSFSNSRQENLAWPTKNGFTKSPPQRRLERASNTPLENDVFLPPLPPPQIYRDYSSDYAVYATRPPNPPQFRTMNLQEMENLRNTQLRENLPPRLTRHESIQLPEPLYGDRRSFYSNYQQNTRIPIRRDVLITDNIYGQHIGYRNEPQYGYASNVEPLYAGRKQVTVRNKVCDIYGKIHDTNNIQTGVLMGQLQNSPTSPQNFRRNTRLTASNNDMLLRRRVEYQNEISHPNAVRPLPPLPPSGKNEKNSSSKKSQKKKKK